MLYTMNSSASHLHAYSSVTTDTALTAASFPPEAHCNGKEAVLDALISKVVNECIFPKKQFIVLERELHVDGKLAQKALQALKMEKKD